MRRRVFGDAADQAGAGIEFATRLQLRHRRFARLSARTAGIGVSCDLTEIPARDVEPVGRPGERRRVR